MRKLNFYAFIMLIILISCENTTDATDTGIPEIRQVIVSDSLSNLTNGIEKTTFTVGDTAYFGLTITDTDLDLDKVVITQKSFTQNIAPIEISIPVQLRDTDFYYSSMVVSIPETWTIEGYAVDKSGNRSNIVSKKIIVNDLVTYTVSYVLGSDEFIETWKSKMSYYKGINPVDTKRYKEGAVVETKTTEIISHNQTGYTHYWNTKADGTGESYRKIMSSVSDYYMVMPAHDVVLYAIWPEALTSEPKEFDPSDYGFNSYVPEHIIGIWSDRRYEYLNPNTTTTINQLGVIVFDETTATSWQQRLNGSKLTTPTTVFIEADESSKILYSISENNKTKNVFGRWDDFGRLWIGAYQSSATIYEKVE